MNINRIYLEPQSNSYITSFRTRGLTKPLVFIIGIYTKNIQIGIDRKDMDKRREQTRQVTSSWNAFFYVGKARESKYFLRNV